MTDSRDAATCSKCGGAETKTRFHDGETYWGDGRTCAYGSAAHPTAHAQGEHLHYTCQTCGFDWTGVTADAEAVT